jgi:hypothetical protein
VDVKALVILVTFYGTQQAPNENAEADETEADDEYSDDHCDLKTQQESCRYPRNNSKRQQN